MPGRLTTITKGTFLGNADDQLLTPTLDHLRWFESDKGLTKIGQDNEVIEPGAEGHSDDEFFGSDPNKAFFPDIPSDETQDIVRGAYIQALRLSLYKNYADRELRERPKPVVSYWIVTGPAGEGESRFEAYTIDSGLEVHVFIVTPDPQNAPTPPTAEYSIDERIWLTGTQAWVDEVKARAPYGYADPVDLGRHDKAVCQQVKGY
jgi:hypothetical protein